jgi:hypothetical protein
MDQNFQAHDGLFEETNIMFILIQTSEFEICFAN